MVLFKYIKNEYEIIYEEEKIRDFSSYNALMVKGIQDKTFLIDIQDTTHIKLILEKTE